MNTTRIAVIAAATAVAAWACKAVAIGLAGGLDKSSFEQPFFLVGLVAFVVAVSTLAVSAVSRYGWLARVAAVLASVVGTVLVTALTGMVVDVLTSSDHWAWYELNLWVISSAVLATGVWSARRRPARLAA